MIQLINASKLMQTHAFHVIIEDLTSFIDQFPILILQFNSQHLHQTLHLVLLHQHIYLRYPVSSSDHQQSKHLPRKLNQKLFSQLPTMSLFQSITKPQSTSF